MTRISIRLALALALLSFQRISFAADLTVTAPALVEWDGVAPSPEIVFGVENTTSTSKFMLAWQLSLQIIPASLSTGTVEFQAATIPDDYLMSGSSLGLMPPLIPPSETLQIGDLDPSANGVTIPFASNLLEVDLVASPEALGEFDIAMLPIGNGSNDSSWLSDSFPFLEEFINTDGAGPVVLTTIRIIETSAIPEPRAASSLLVVGLVALPWIRRRRALRR